MQHSYALLMPPIEKIVMHQKKILVRLIYMFMSSNQILSQMLSLYGIQDKHAFYNFGFCNNLIFLPIWLDIYIVEFDILFANCFQHTSWYCWCHFYNFVIARERWRLKVGYCASVVQVRVSFLLDHSKASYCKSLCPLCNLVAEKGELFSLPNLHICLTVVEKVASCFFSNGRNKMVMLCCIDSFATESVP